MDGNGRWAAARGRPRSYGHKAGVEAVRRTVKAAADLGVEYLTLFAFSSENWSRPREEVRDLFGLMKFFVTRDLAELCANGVRIRVLGDRSGLSSDILGLIETAETKSRQNTALQLNIAFNYGARNELRRAFAAVAKRCAEEGRDPSQIGEDEIAAALDTAGQPDPDLVIRTSGEMRLSNFMLWQAAYAEFVFLPCMWPDFDKEWLQRAISEFSSRTRRYGGIDAAKDVAL
ncbi:polyprenyl diphosphate synthase [Oricola thermophila]|uniref:Isoprenyl transferase n=1 Tax=Oricola thermophila TaxID=2742145 RepID=A0A6N1VNN9_9HYPH|nr:polyprenyl diphosphate synthase [Oricola thermophila]QKV20557.1 di-trans,poly-cis-decaprenylcistransferase [Oricola thermophila]